MGLANPWAGEVAISLNGQLYQAKLTLGALAELEASLKAQSLIELIERFESGQFTARDVLAVLAAGLRGGGWQGTVDELVSADLEGGPLVGARSAAELLARAFSLPGEAQG